MLLDQSCCPDLPDKAAKCTQLSPPWPSVGLLGKAKGDWGIVPLPGTTLGQTTPSPTVMSTALAGNVTSLTVTPVILSSTAPGCAAFNLSTCEQCAPGSQYDNGESQIHRVTHYVMFGWSNLNLKEKNAGTIINFFVPSFHRYSFVFMLLQPWAVSISWGLPAM